MRITDTINIAKSGMQAASLRLQNSAHNIANTLTLGFHPGRVVSLARPSGGVSAHIETPDPPHLIVQQNGHAAGPSNTDLGTEIVSQMQAVHAYSASAKTLATSDEMNETLLDMLA
jgi:flagellar hook protein FlgE